MHKLSVSINFSNIIIMAPTFGIGRSLALSEEVPLPPVLDVRVYFEVGHNQNDKGDDPKGEGPEPVGGNGVGRVFPESSGSHLPPAHCLVTFVTDGLICKE